VGEALRCPELPADSYHLSVTEGRRQEVLQACADLAIEVRPLVSYLTGRGAPV
jgi:hypothetical protein